MDRCRGDKCNPVDPNKALRGCALALCGLIALALFLLFELFLGFLLFFSSGILRGTAGWVAISIFSYLISVLLITTCCVLPCLYYHNRSGEASEDTEVAHYTKDPKGDKRRSALSSRWKAIAAVFIGGLIGVFLFIEVCLVVANPVQSVFPLRPVSADAFEESEYRPAGCSMDIIVETAKAFYVNSTVDFSPLRVVYGGLPLHFELARAQVVDTTVYLQSGYCPSIAIMVHELAHVWQFQEGTWFSVFANEFFSWLLEQAQCRSCPYDYGDLQGLTDAFAANKDMSFFGFEQQATIVEDYFRLLDGGFTADPALPLLKHFADQILQDAL